VKELGEKRFQEFLKEHGSDYAEGYRELGNRSYQANANRLASALIEGFISDSKAIPTSLRVLDIASGPEMLRRHGSKIYRDQIISMDLNPEHFKKSKGPSVSGSWLNMPFKQGTFDYLNLSLSLHYTSYIPSKGKLERVKVLSEMNRVLKIGGRAVISLIYSYGLKHPELFRESVKELGFEVREASTGESTSGSFFRSYIITLEKKRDLDPNLTVDEINIRMSKEMRDGLKFKEIKGRLKDSRRILTGVEFNGRLLPIHLNEEDREAYVEEQQILKQGEELRDRHGDIRRIPPAEIVENGFVRIRSGKKYVLFKKLERGSGVVLVR
ncbi:class I SAM-dependent methyltransferase, partial [Candidatus Uhrbacteria bacterium]